MSDILAPDILRLYNAGPKELHIAYTPSSVNLSQPPKSTDVNEDLKEVL